MTFKQLEYFVTIAELENITAASKILNIAQPPLSYQLKSLEDELGVKLFTRNGRNLKITQEGLILQNKAVQILSMLNGTLQEIQNYGKAIHHTITIGTVTSVSNRLLPDKILHFHQDNPNVDFQIWEGNSLRIMKLLDNGVVDFGLIREPIDINLYNSKTIKDTALDDSQLDYFVAMAKENFFEETHITSITLTDLKGKPLIIHRRFENLLVTACRQCGFYPNILCRNDDITSSISWAEAGIGIAIAPYTSSTLASSDKIIIKKIIEPSINSKVLLIWRKDNHISNTADEFIKLF